MQSWRNLRKGVLGVLGSASHDTLGGVAAGVVLVDDAVFCLCVNLGMGLVALDFSSKGVLDSEASAPAVHLEKMSWWSKKWSPSVVRTSDGEPHLDTPFSRLLGKPLITVAGMTPSTVKARRLALSAQFSIPVITSGWLEAVTTMPRPRLSIQKSQKSRS
ncbi:hypothetical protein BJ912DRAFT_1097931 [Pholiota molesta]|nr:hypothetical protein BJ912DRAFT_1097931 [Pholiota molesta]